MKKTDALIVIDMQNDFIPGGALEVSGGDEIIKPIAELASKFHEAGATIVMSQDWHPSGHKSFASSNDVAPFSTIKLPYGEQTMWPDHCVQNTNGGAFHEGMAEVEMISDAIIRKGTNPEIDSYSAFYENDRKTSTGLAGFLRERGITRVYFVGLAYDFCVAYSALDAIAEGFESIVIKDMSRAIAMHVSSGLGHRTTTVDVMERKFFENNVKVIKTL